MHALCEHSFTTVCISLCVLDTYMRLGMSVCFHFRCAFIWMRLGMSVCFHFHILHISSTVGLAAEAFLDTALDQESESLQVCSWQFMCTLVVRLHAAGARDMSITPCVHGQARTG